MDARGLPVGEVAAMFRSAQEALDNGDMDLLLKINGELQSVGFSLMVRGGRVQLRNETHDVAAPAVGANGSRY